MKESTPDTRSADNGYRPALTPETPAPVTTTYANNRAITLMWVLLMGFFLWVAFLLVTPSIFTYYPFLIVLTLLYIGGGIAAVRRVNSHRETITAAATLPALPVTYGSKWTGQIVFEPDRIVLPNLLTKPSIPYQQIAFVSIFKLGGGSLTRDEPRTMLMLYRSVPGAESSLDNHPLEYRLSPLVPVSQWPLLLALLQAQAPQAQFDDTSLQIIKGIIPPDLPRR